MTKDFYQCRIQERSYLSGSTVSKALDSFRFLSFNIPSLAFNLRSPGSRVQRPGSVSTVQSPAPRVQRLESSVQSPTSRVQSPTSSIQSPGSRVQRPESSVQSPASRVQRPTLVSRVQEFRYAYFLLTNIPESM